MSTAFLDEALFIGSSSMSASSAGVSPASRVHLFGEVVPGWRFENPLPIVVEREADDTIVVSDEIFDVYGCGRSWDEAAQDYRVALIEFFEIACAGQDAHSRRLVSHLKAYIRRA